MARAIDADALYDLVERRYKVSNGIEHRCERNLLDLICNMPTLTPPNEALTLNELRKMDGEPVFVKWTDNRILPRWYIVGCYEWNLMDFDAFEDYGKWLAYRRPPEGEA